MRGTPVWRQPWLHTALLSVGLFVHPGWGRADPPADPTTDDQDTSRLLELDLEALLDIEVVTASKRKQTTSRVPATVRVITAEQIRARGYLRLDQALAGLPGIQFRDILGINSYVFVRGVPNQNNLALILVDGLEMNELNSGGFYGGGHYNLGNVQRIAVVYGPGSAMYGTNAVSEQDQSSETCAQAPAIVVLCSSNGCFVFTVIDGCDRTET